MQAKNEAARIEHNRRAWAVWHIAALQRRKKMPSLKSLTTQKKPAAQSWEQQFAIMEAWATARNKKLEQQGKGHG